MPLLNNYITYRSSTDLSVADIFREHWAAYRRRHPDLKRIRYAGLHSSSARQEKLPRCRSLLGLPAELPEVKALSLLEWLAEVLGEEQVDRCPHCGTVGSLCKRAEFERLPWLVALLLSLVSQPTRQGVCR
jgi:hypothetical protein